MRELQPVSFKYVTTVRKIVDYEEEWIGTRETWGDHFDDLLRKCAAKQANQADWSELVDGCDPDHEEAVRVLHGEFGLAECDPHLRRIEVTWEDGSITEQILHRTAGF